MATAPARQATIIAALERAGATQPCVRCGHPTFEVVASSVRDVADADDGATMRRIPTIVLACKQCACLVEHAAKPLGLMLG